MIQYVDTFRDRFGVEAICRTLGATECGFMTARGYRAAKNRPLSARAMSDQLLGAEMVRLHADNYGVYGVRKMHALMRRQGWALGRDQTGRIMRSRGLRGVKRNKRVFTTKSDPAGIKPLDLVQRQFIAAAPRRLWVVDITYVRTWQGFAYVAFVTDVFSRRIVGWNVASTLKADILPLQALDMAAFTAGGDLTGLTHHSDHGSNGGFNWSSQHLVIVEVFDGSSSAGSRPSGAPEVEVAWSSEVPAVGRRGVLGRDCQGIAAHRGGRGRRGVAAGRSTLVP